MSKPNASFGSLQSCKGYFSLNGFDAWDVERAKFKGIITMQVVFAGETLSVPLIIPMHAQKNHRAKATFHLTISMRGQRATGKIQRNNYHHGSCGLSLTG